ncbi:MAG: site-specific integrase, partial [Acidimicrobiia bacterium]|nr:site-specific integrase [Acidimicrobiia bacterium]
MARIPAPPAWAVVPLDSYLARLRTQRGLSIHSIEAYRRDLSQFLAFCDGADCRDVTDIDRRLIRRFLAHLDALGYARRSINRKASAVRAWCADLARRGELSANP